MSCRPTQIVCADCPTVVPVKPSGRMPSRCPSCAEQHHKREWRAQREYERLHGEPPTTRSKAGPFALGPARPEGMTAKERLAWCEQRAVQLYREEPDLTLDDIAERLGVTHSVVSRCLDEAGVKRRPYEVRLPAGLPVY